MLSVSRQESEGFGEKQQVKELIGLVRQPLLALIDLPNLQS
jgi:hypothetical protein